MAKRLPPLNSIRAFEVAGRTLNFSKAADELHVTHGAVSKQIKTLESYLEIELFNRSKTGMALTNSGERYLYQIQHALGEIASATRQLQEEDIKEHLTIEASSAFSSFWLFPKIGEFCKHFPEVHLEIISRNSYAENDNEANLVIKGYPLDSAPSTAQLLKHEVLLCLVNPAIVSKQQLRSKNLEGLPLLGITNRKNVWQQALPTQGEKQLNQQIKYSFPHYLLGVEAANQGLGVCVLPDFLADEVIEKGNLVPFENIRVETGYGYYSLVSPFHVNNRSVLHFCDWLSQALH